MLSVPDRDELSANSNNAAMTDSHSKLRLVGLNHIAIEVGDIGEALDFYGSIFEFTPRNRFERMAWIDLGDQFIALSMNAAPAPDDDRHFGLVVDSKEETRRAMEAAGVDALPGQGLRFRDPWGNQVEIVDYREIQYTQGSRCAQRHGDRGAGEDRRGVRGASR